MYCIVQFRMLLFILTYVLYIVNVSCNNDTLKAEINPSAGKWSTSLNTSNTNVMLGEVKHSENKTKQVFFGEGGSMSPAFTDKNYDSSTLKTSIQNETLNEKIFQHEVPFGLNDSSISSDHKPRIGRKGVDASKETSLEETPVEHNSNEPTKTIELGQKSVATNVSNLTSSTIQPNNLTSNFTINSTNANGTTRASTSSQGNLNQSTSSSTMLTNSPVSRNGIQNSTSENTLNVSELTPPKPKPEFTRDDSDVDDNSYSLTNPENDYVIPVVATIFAAPLLIVLAMFLYKRSKEFWERRHYRRMDFLIDGMYND